ncbi:MAG: chemotaxis protein CheW [Deltaproteobacteria bacterium]
MSLCAFDVGSEAYALDLRRVREILRPLRVTPVPRAPAFIEGVIQLRGTVVPVIDLRRRLLAPVTQGAGVRFLLCLIGRRQVALAVDRVAGVLRVSRSELKPAPPLSKGSTWILGVCKDDDRLRLLLDLPALLASDEPALVSDGASDRAGGVAGRAG